MGRQTPPFCWEDPAEAVLSGLCPSRVGVGHQAPTLPLSFALPTVHMAHTHFQIEAEIQEVRGAFVCL